MPLTDALLSIATETIPPADREWRPGDVCYVEGKLPGRISGYGTRPGLLRVTVPGAAPVVLPAMLFRLLISG